VHAGVGGVTETDIMLAAAANAIIIGFNVRPTPKAKEMAVKEEVDLRFYNIIYRVIEDIEKARIGLLAPEISEVELGRAKVLDIFKVSKVGTVAGCMVEEGEIKAGARVRVVREGVIIQDGVLDSLKRFKNDAATVAEGLECGLHIENYNDIKVDDQIEAYEVVETPRT
jgi:translation initiation factor IF-2